ncbi:MAG TPA: hypothetical protein VIW68_09530 [Candidatus Sulfotelmatobacter sp.]
MVTLVHLGYFLAACYFTAGHFVLRLGYAFGFQAYSPSAASIF